VEEKIEIEKGNLFIGCYEKLNCSRSSSSGWTFATILKDK